VGAVRLKSLISPLLWFLLIQIVASGLLLRRRYTGCGRGLPLVTLYSTLLLGVLAMPLTANVLEATLQINSPEEAAFSPTHIFVLGGGYQLGNYPDEDLLIQESQLRVLHGIAVWKRYPVARLVFSGASREDGREDARHAELARDMAVLRGVPTDAIMMETHSLNTRGHPVEALRLPGVSASTPIGLVTSGWHTRRAQREFRRYFQRVALYPVPLVIRPWQWQDLVPAADSLDGSTTLLREWAGLLWCVIFDCFVHQVSDNHST